MANSISSDVSTFNSTYCNRENKFSKMKKLVGAMESYLETRSESHELIINQHLQALSLSLDLSIFDPHTNIAGKFFTVLHDLMDILEPRSLTAWYCVDVLLSACKNPSARLALKESYQFLPCLARMISDQLRPEKKTRLLRLMQDITCGIKICWQVPHLTHLVSMLCKWIERQEPDVVALSLGVLVNLCYKNLPVAYILQSNVDLKRFIRICLALKGPIVEVYVCQLTIMLENMPGFIPALIFPKLVDSTFTAVLEAYRTKDSIVLLQVVEFFSEYVKNHSSLLIGFDKFEERFGSILEVIEISRDCSKDPECLSVVLDFINFLIDAKAPQISNFYSRLIPLAMKWIQESTVSFQALALLRTISVNVNKEENKMLETLIAGLRHFILILNTCKEEKIMHHTVYVKRLSALLQLLTAMIQVNGIRDRVVNELEENIFTSIFATLIGDDSPLAGEFSCSVEAVNLYISALALLSKLVECNPPPWMGLLKSLLENRQIHVIIAQGICLCPPDCKKTALELSVSCSDGVSLAMTNLQSLMSSGKVSRNHVSSPQPNDFAFSLIPLAQHERLQTVIENIENKISQNEVNNLAMSEIMELYNYKFSYLSQRERAALASVEASTKHCSHLQRRISKLTCEHVKLQQSEYHTTKKLEETAKKMEELHTELRDLQNKYEAEKGRYKAMHSQFVAKEKALGEFEAALKDTEIKLSKLQQLFNKVEENCRKHEKNEQKKEEQLKNANETIKNYTMQLNELETILKEKERQLEDAKGNLQLKSTILESIMKMANSQSFSGSHK